MDKIKLIDDLSDQDVQDLVRSIDIFLFDVDGCIHSEGIRSSTIFIHRSCVEGVLIRDKVLIPGANDLVDKLRKLGKKIGFVTNNSIYPIDLIQQNLALFGAQPDDIITPNKSLLGYLKKIDFKKDIYVIGSSLPKAILKEAGYNVIEYKDIQSTDLENNLSAIRDLAVKTLERCKNVGIVYLDSDFNCQNGAIQVAKFILNHIDGVQLLTGMNDDTAPVDGPISVICAQYYIDGIKRWTSKQALDVGKPGKPLTDTINEIFDVSDSKRVLMVGDNVTTDIVFGVNSGYETCLTLSGVTKKDQVDNWTYPEEWKPDYITSSLKNIYDKIITMKF